ncbi:MAG: YcaQ family DNA glycosylase [Gemmatimonadaceae bacterium]|nr:YcaQ family DNA glycosylase [Gemmatimonadaceae bacterium]
MATPRGTLDIPRLRQFALRRQLPAPTTLGRALRRLGFVQADPIRAPARAQDLTLRHRVVDYRAGDLERRYPRLAVEEDFFVNYGFVTRDLHALMHPRAERRTFTASERKRAAAILEFVRERGVVHPREVDLHFAHGKATNWFGGTSNVTTQLMDGMHHRGILRVARREGGTRLYAAREQTPPAADPAAAMDAFVDVLVAKYAPLTASMLTSLVSRLWYAAPQWAETRKDAGARARKRLHHMHVDGVAWYWPEGESPATRRVVPPDTVRLLAPFDPFVWDRRRFELFNGWAYRFEAYTPAPKRVRGYYALPLAWRDTVIGWANLAVRDGQLVPDIGYVSGRAPRDAGFRQALDEELDRCRVFLSL